MLVFCCSCVSLYLGLFSVESTLCSLKGAVSDRQNDQLEMHCLQILSSRMTEAPQPSVTASKKEEIPTEPTFKAVIEDKEDQLPTDE